MEDYEKGLNMNLSFVELKCGTNNPMAKAIEGLGRIDMSNIMRSPLNRLEPVLKSTVQELLDLKETSTVDSILADVLDSKIDTVKKDTLVLRYKILLRVVAIKTEELKAINKDKELAKLDARIVNAKEKQDGEMSLEELLKLRDSLSK